MLTIGQAAPDFDLEDEQGNRVRLADFRGKSSVVLMFYPKDETPGCTRQMCAARDDFDRYREAGVAVFGINPAGPDEHQRFVERHELKTPLLVDVGAKVARAYDALMPIPILNIVNRTVVGIDPDGKVRFYERGMPGADRILPAMTGEAAAAG